MTQQSSPVSSESGADTPRVDQFRSDVADLEIPAPSASSETRLLWIGVALVVMGVISILAGYWGASGTVDPAAQLPYMLSGGAVGLALVVLGSFLVGRYSMARLLRFWLARLVVEHRVQTDRLIEAITDSQRT